MKRTLIAAGIVAIALPLAVPIALPTAAEAGTIQRACLQSDRRGVNRSLCACIQSAADATLTGREQRMAARFFSDPHQAQVVRQSDRSEHRVFWERYRRFGQVAEAYCG